MAAQGNPFTPAQASASGKVILFGEHAVVYGQPALAVPVAQVQATAVVSALSPAQAPERLEAGIWIEARDLRRRYQLSEASPNDPLAAAIRLTLARYPSSAVPASAPPFALALSSTIPIGSGLGSGAAVCTAAVRALGAFLGLSLSSAEVSGLVYETEKLLHGTPSGIDNTVVTFACPVYFVKGQTNETLRVGAPFTVVIGDTGIPALTKESVADVRRLWEEDIPHWEKVFDEVGDLARRAREAIERGNASYLGELMNLNHALLQTMTVSSPDLDRLVHVARSTGALGAKLSGGGRGGNMIALVKPERAEIIANALRTVGARNTIITTVQ